MIYNNQMIYKFTRTNWFKTLKEVIYNKKLIYKVIRAKKVYKNQKPTRTAIIKMLKYSQAQTQIFIIRINKSAQHCHSTDRQK